LPGHCREVNQQEEQEVCSAGVALDTGGEEAQELVGCGGAAARGRKKREKRGEDESRGG
jgi:hypothetical protein